MRLPAIFTGQQHAAWRQIDYGKPSQRTEILLFAAVFQFFVWAVPPQNLLIKLVLSELESTRYLVLGKFTKLSKILKQGSKYLGITSVFT